MAFQAKERMNNDTKKITKKKVNEKAKRFREIA